MEETKFLYETEIWNGRKIIIIIIIIIIISIQPLG